MVVIATVRPVLMATMRAIQNPDVLVVIGSRLVRFLNQPLSVWVDGTGTDTAHHLHPSIDDRELPDFMALWL
jgi:thiamine pyrophosphate-dependent acetolactate synthase large subunit-like protein